MARARALIITGDGILEDEDQDYFTPTGERLIDHLRTVGIKDIQLIQGREQDDQSILKLIRHYSRRSRYPLLVSFHGHGNELGWRININPDYRVKYQDLAKDLIPSKVPVQIVS